MAFWGIEIKPGEPYVHQYDDEKGRLHLSQATLGSGKSKEKAVVVCNVGDKKPIYLCSLLPRKMETCSLNIEFEEYDGVTFSVEGSHNIHLSGFFYGNEPDSDGDDYEFSDEDDSGEDSDFDDEDDLTDDEVDMFPSSNLPNGGELRRLLMMRNRTRALFLNKQRSRINKRPIMLTTFQVKRVKKGKPRGKTRWMILKIKQNERKMILLKFQHRNRMSRNQRRRTRKQKIHEKMLTLTTKFRRRKPIKSKHPKSTVHYIGKLKKNGKIFDSNIGKAPFRFRLGAGEVIAGWDVGIKGMCVGEKRRLTIPPSMGYGAGGAGSAIPPNSWLVFDVELVNVN
ncbi:putative peptidylprolyl isomerase [Helianthus annuus]|nr:putative peptidylprolyl isomerase [Helianthus annuus]